MVVERMLAHESVEKLVSRLGGASELRLKVYGGGWKPPILFMREMGGAVREVPNVERELLLTIVFASAIAFAPNDREEEVKYVGRIAEILLSDHEEIDEIVENIMSLARQIRLGADGRSFGVPSKIQRILNERNEHSETGEAGWLFEAARAAFNTPNMPVTRVAIYRDQAYGESYTFYLRRSPLVSLINALNWAANQRMKALQNAGIGVLPPKPGDLEKSAALISEACYAALMDGYIFFIVGQTGVGKTTVQNAILMELEGRINGPIVVVEAYPELEAYLSILWDSSRGIRSGQYYCMYGVGEMGEQNPLTDMMRVITSGNIRLLVIQEANLSLLPIFRDMYNSILRSGVPTIVTAFATVPHYTTEAVEYAVGGAVVSDVSYRLFGEPDRLRRAAVLALPANQLYLVGTDGVAHPLFGYETDREGRVAVFPHLRPVSGNVAPHGTYLGSLLKAALSTK